MIESFEKKPANGGMPASASEPIDRGDVRDRHVFAQPAHPAQVLLVVERDDHRAGAEEQQRLEERMRHQVEDRRRVRRHAERHRHVAELRQRRIRDDALDVVLHDAEERHEERRDRADDRDERQRRLRPLEQRAHPRHHEDAGRDHRRRVDQRRDRRRAFHRVGQPHVQRHLRALAHRADEQADADRASSATSAPPLHGSMVPRHRLRRFANTGA